MNTLNLYKNWRITTLVAIACVAVLLLVAEADTVRVFLITKLAGIALIIAAALLFRVWKKDGKVSELDNVKE